MTRRTANLTSKSSLSAIESALAERKADYCPPAEYFEGLSDEGLISVMDAFIDNIRGEKAAAEYGKRQAKKTLVNAATLLLEDITKGDLVSAAWAASRISDLITDEKTLAAYGKRLEGDFRTGQRLVDIAQGDPAEHQDDDEPIIDPFSCEH